MAQSILDWLEIPLRKEINALLFNLDPGKFLRGGKKAEKFFGEILSEESLVQLLIPP